jgi:hypothetical protein
MVTSVGFFENAVTPTQWTMEDLLFRSSDHFE